MIDDLVGRLRAAIDPEVIVALALELLGQPSPAGHEQPLAEWLAGWVADRSSVPVRLDTLGKDRANLVLGAPTGPELAFYGHLDTSLSGDPEIDGPLTGRRDLIAAPELRDGVIWGHGAAVAKVPTAAAVVTALALAETLATDGTRVGALVAAGGTHRSGPPWPGRPTAAVLGRTAEVSGQMGTGVRAALDAHWWPGAVICAKGGAPAPLYEEPGSLYLAVTLEENYGAVLGRSSGPDLPGVVAAVPKVLEAIRDWRLVHLDGRREPLGQLARDVAVGAVEVGLAAKPDLLGQTARLYLYVVTVPGDEDARIAASLASVLEPHVEDWALRSIQVEPYGSLPPGRTPKDHPLVTAAQLAWSRLGRPEQVVGWRGSTDGSLLRARGIPTVRVGPRLLADPVDPRVEGVAVDEVTALVGVWVETAVRYLTLPGAVGPQPEG